MSTVDPGSELPFGIFGGARVGATVLRMMLGTQLRRLREAAGVTPDQAGYEIRASRSKISRLERGRVGFKERDVADLLTLYGVTDEQLHAAVLSLARQSNADDWWAKYGDILPDWFEAYLGLEAAASLVRTFELQFVHGLFQTEDLRSRDHLARPPIRTCRGDQSPGEPADEAPGSAGRTRPASSVVHHGRGGAATADGRPGRDARAAEPPD